MGINEFVKQINKAEKKEVVRRANTIPDLPRFSTGSLSLDAECGSNSEGDAGFAVGRVIGITGEEGTGKSVVATKAAAGYLKKFPEQGIVWIDAEGTFDAIFARSLGLNIDDPHVFIMTPEFSEQAFNAVLHAVDQNVGLVVIDSLGALSPKEEMEAEMEKMTVGIQARLNRKMLRRFTATVNDKGFAIPSTLIYINHLNEKVGASSSIGGAVPLVEPGGRALKFFPSIKIRMKKGGHYPKSVTTADEGVEPKAQELKFHVEKNKTAPPFRRGHFWFYFDTLDEYRRKGSIDVLEETIRYAKKYDILKRHGNSNSMVDLLDPSTGELHTLNGSAEIATFLRANGATYASVRDQVVKRVRGEMIDSGAPVSEDEELEAKGNDKKKGRKSSEGTERREGTSIRSDTVEERGHSNGSIPDTAQGDEIEISLDQFSEPREVKT